MAKEKKQDGGWQFPKALEIIKCKEGNKEFMKERPARRPFGNTVLVCEYPLDGDAMQEPNARMITWRLAKRAASLHRRRRERQRSRALPFYGSYL